MILSPTNSLLRIPASAMDFIESVIVNQKGEIIAGSNLMKQNMKTTKINNDAIKQDIYPEPDVIQLLNSNSKNILIKNSNGKQVIYCLSEIATLNWFYIEKLDLDLFLKN